MRACAPQGPWGPYAFLHLLLARNLAREVVVVCLHHNACIHIYNGVFVHGDAGELTEKLKAHVAYELLEDPEAVFRP